MRFKTKVVPKTLSPTWNETFELNVTDPEKETLHCEVFDHDLVRFVDIFAEFILIAKWFSDWWS